MKSNDQNSGYTWPSRVRNYNYVPNRKTSTEENWQKLRERLDKARGKRKRFKWYGAAAASVILFFAIKLIFTIGSDERVKPGFTKSPGMLKQNNHALIPVDTIQAATNTAVKPSNPATKKPVPGSMLILQPVQAKIQSVLPAPVDSANPTVKDTPVAENDIAQELSRLPSVHINDLITTDPQPPHISTKSLSVKKMIRLFSPDFTSGQPPKKQEEIPKSQYTIPNNQN